MIHNLVFAGGQIKGLAYIGALKILEESKIIRHIKTILGVSSGAIFGLLMFLGTSYNQLVNIAFNVCTYENIRTNKKLDISDIIDSYGIESGENIIKIIRVILEKKTGRKDCSFTDLAEIYPEKKMVIVGMNISKNKLEYFSKETTPDMKILEAIRISISIPLVFTKKEYKKDIYVDGGIGCNIPIDYFKDTLDNTLCFCISSPNYLTDIDSFESYISRVFRILMDNIDRYIIERYKNNIIEILVDYDYFNINLSESKIKYLIDAGATQTETEIHKTRFSDYFIINDILQSVISNIENSTK